MANNRSIISWETVLKAKEKFEIKNMLIENYKAIYGADIVVDARTADAGWIDALTDILYDFSLLAVNVYDSLDISNARGALLDNLVLLAGNIVRHIPTKTKIQCQLTWTGSDISYDKANDILSALDVENKKWIITPVEDDAIIYSSGEYPAGGDQLVYLEHSYEGEYLIPLDANPILEIRKNSSFQTNNNILLTNKIMLNRGTFAETDSQLKSRKKESLAYNSTSLVDSIRDAVLNSIYSIKDIKIYSSVGATALTVDLWNGSTSGTVTIPLHDVFVLVKPDEGVDIIQGEAISTALVDILQRKITLGISTYQSNIDSNYHTLTVPVNSEYNTYTETYRYYVAQPYKPNITINYKPSNGFNRNTMAQRVINAIYNLAKDYAIDRDIDTIELGSTISSAANLSLTNKTCDITSVVVDNTVVNNGYWYVNLADELEFLSSELALGETYEIVDLGTTDWNAVFGTTGVTYDEGDSGVVASVAPGTGRAVSINHKLNFVEVI